MRFILPFGRREKDCDSVSSPLEEGRIYYHPTKVTSDECLSLVKTRGLTGLGWRIADLRQIFCHVDGVVRSAVLCFFREGKLCLVW